jgi:hypothetical protein
MEPTFDAACALLESILGSTTRQELVDEVAKASNLRQALLRLREPLRSHAFRSRTNQLGLDKVVRTYDSLTRQDGFHALHDWDGKADSVNQNTIALDVLDYIAGKRGGDPVDRTVVAVVLDYYFMYLLALLSLRVWDEGRPDEHLDAVDRLLELLQGTHGSGHRFADDAATLMLVATAHFELDDAAYDRLLERARHLNQPHRAALGRVHAASLGSHLRFGFDVTYGRDLRNMRADNGVDYRWLLFALATLMDEYARIRRERVDGPARAIVVEALLNGLSPDSGAFVAESPECLSPLATERDEFIAGFKEHRDELVAEFEPFRPSDRLYSPLSFSFNFSHNVVKGIVVDSLLWGEPCRLTLNDLLTGFPREAATSAAKERLAKTLVAYARASPDTIRGRPMPVITYDPSAGRQAFAFMMRTLRA